MVYTYIQDSLKAYFCHNCPSRHVCKCESVEKACEFFDNMHDINIISWTIKDIHKMNCLTMCHHGSFKLIHNYCKNRQFYTYNINFIHFVQF